MYQMEIDGVQYRFEEECGITLYAALQKRLGQDSVPEVVRCSDGVTYWTRSTFLGSCDGSTLLSVPQGSGSEVHALTADSLLSGSALA